MAEPDTALPAEAQAATLRQLLLEATQRLAVYERPTTELGGTHLMTLHVTTRGVHVDVTPHLNVLDPTDQRIVLAEALTHLQQAIDEMQINATLEE